MYGSEKPHSGNYIWKFLLSYEKVIILFNSNNKFCVLYKYHNY